MTAAIQPPVTARLAATIMLLREAPGGPETLLVRRHGAIAFMGGVWVFPGGKLEPSDTADEALASVPAAARQRCEAWAAGSQRPCSSREASGLYVAACRETFEEAGVLLARRPDGAPFPAAEVARVRDERVEIAARPAAFSEVLRREGLRLDPGLVPWAHWVTPSLERIRFDARFFAAALDGDHEVVPDATESTGHAWMRPADALAAYERGDLVLAGPTVITLAEAAASLAAHGSVAALLAAEAGRPIVPIVPRLRRDAGGVTAYLPWDPEYEGLEGEGGPVGDAIPARLRAFPSRMALPRAERRIVR